LLRTYGMVEDARQYEDDCPPQSVVLQIFPDDTSEGSRSYSDDEPTQVGSPWESSGSFPPGGKCVSRSRSYSDDEPTQAGSPWDSSGSYPLDGKSISRHKLRTQRPKVREQMLSTSPRALSMSPKAHVPTPQPVMKAREFQVTIMKESQDLGLDVLQHDSATLLITGIKEGLVATFNRGQPDDVFVQAGDRIAEVNGSRGNSEELIHTIRSSQTVCMTIRRLVEFTVTVSKLSRRLGINVMQGGCSLTVLGLTEGPFTQWNSCVNQDLKVQPGDLVVEVDGVRGTAETLLQAIHTGGDNLRMSFVVERGRLASVPRL